MYTHFVRWIILSMFQMILKTFSPFSFSPLRSLFPDCPRLIMYTHIKWHSVTNFPSLFHRDMFIYNCVIPSFRSFFLNCILLTNAFSLTFCNFSSKKCAQMTVKSNLMTWKTFSTLPRAWNFSTSKVAFHSRFSNDNGWGEREKEKSLFLYLRNNARQQQSVKKLPALHQKVISHYTKQS